MTLGFQIALAVLTLSLYLVGYISWRVQQDALKRGYSSTSATFWSLSVLFFIPIMLPLYVLFRQKAVPETRAIDKVSEAKRKLYITCAHCGEENPPDVDRCQKCEKSLIGEGKAVGTKACPYCGEMNDIKAVYCANCKQPI